MQHLEEVLDLSRQSARGSLSPWFDVRLREQVQSEEFLSPAALETVGKRLVEQLADYRYQTGVSTAVLGMSGGVDSALTAALLKKAGWRVVGYTLPIEQDSIETERGVEGCSALGLEHKHLDLTPHYRHLVAGLASLDDELGFSDAEPLRTRRGNLRARLRMMTLYDQAHRCGGLVASTDNFSELGAGFWTLHGDVGDLAPVQSLLKSWEIPWMARRYGVPESTWRANPTDGLGIGKGDEAQIGATYLEWDITVFAVVQILREKPTLSLDDLAEALGAKNDPVAPRVSAAVLRRLRSTWFKRINPIAFKHPVADRFEMLEQIDDRLFRPAVLRNAYALTSFSGEIAVLGQRLAHRLAERKLRIVTAESCTAGLLGACIAATPSSSTVLEGSIVTYRPEMKTDALGVRDDLIRHRTVYDPDVAREMAEGALQRANGSDLAISITGVAGPNSDQGKPVGLVYIATVHRSGRTEVNECHFSGKPSEIVAAAIREALLLGLDALR